MSARHSAGPPWVRIVALAAMAVLVLAMALSTRWLTLAQEQEVNPAAFDPTHYAQTKFPHIKDTVTEKAVDLRTLAPAVASGGDKAAKEHGAETNGKYTVAVRYSGVVLSVDENFILFADAPELAGAKVRIPLGMALNGTPIRDVTGEIRFGDFVDQTAYQSVANELRSQMEKTVLSPVDKTALVGKSITVWGAWQTGGPPKSFVVQPVAIEVT